MQDFLHKLEEGKGMAIVKLLAVLCLGLGVMIIVVFDPMYWSFFRGLSHAKGMEQAQIARELAAGNGYSTKMIRPLAAEQIKNHLGNVEEAETKARMHELLKKDTYHAPLWSFTMAPVFKAMQGQWEMDPKKAIYALDKAVAVLSILLFYMAVAVNYFTLKRLFDPTLALIGSVLQLITYPFWQYAMSGLPQMLLLLLFSGITWALVRAIEAQEERKSGLRWVLLIAVLSGLMVLTHYLTAWIVLGLVIFMMIHFRTRLRDGGIVIGVVLLMVSPWLVRNYQITGNPAGVAIFSSWHDVAGSEEVVMRKSGPNAFKVNYFNFRSKLQKGLTDEISNAPSRLGGWIAPLFFVTLLYPFRRKGISTLRWALLAMWLAALPGMALFRAGDIATPLSATNLHLLFIPLFAGYGIAFVMTLWGGLKIRMPFLRKSLIGVILFLAGLPFLNALLDKSFPLWWPPYAPPYMHFLNKWTQPNEGIVSDMPWAIAWYSDRYGLWLPSNPAAFVDYNDYNRLGHPFGGMFLTPITEGAGFMTDIIHGRYKDWAPFILRTRAVQDFPFTKALPLGPKGQCVFYSDFERWSPDEADRLKKMQEDAEAAEKNESEEGASK